MKNALLTFQNTQSKVALFVLILLFSTTISAQIVSQNEVSTVARRLIQERSGIIDNVENIDVFSSSKNIPLYYICNMKSGGWVLVSAHKNCVPVIAYNFEGSFNNQLNLENFHAWMTQCERQIEFASENRVEVSEDISEMWNHFTKDNFQPSSPKNEVLPMIYSTWNQNWPYNAACPEDPQGNHGHCYAGCVPTAMAQVMFYHRWPISGVGSYSYDDPEYGTLSADFENAEYLWDEMVLNASEVNNEIAELLFHLGVSCDLQYGPDGSGMYNHKAAYALRTHFKYSQETEYLYRDSTSIDWTAKVVEQLNLGLPLYYAGWSVPNVVGHAFVCDGYQNEDYFHFNWGWGGSNDGYFYLDELTPGGSYFNDAQELIINCFPDTVSYDYPPSYSDFTEFNMMSGSFDDGSSPSYNYEPNVERAWLINPQTVMDSVSSISITFQYFETEENQDFLKIYDGADQNAPLLETLSGDLSCPLTITSTGNQLFILFESNSTVQQNGWLATYDCLQPEWCSTSEEYFENQAQFSDGSLDFFYYNNTVCMWKILPENEEPISLFVDFMDIQIDVDAVDVYDIESNELLAELSGDFPTGIPTPIVAESGKMLLIFHSDASERGEGWNMHYVTGSVGVESGNNEKKIFSVAPTPATDFVEISCSKNVYLLEILDLSGRVTMQIDSPNEHSSVDISRLSSGIYFVRASSPKNVQCQKLLVR